MPYSGSIELNNKIDGELNRLREFTARIGSDPLLTQASTGNTSIKRDGSLWIKASGRWMAGALREDAFVRLNLAEVMAAVRQNVDPAECFRGASIETAMHARLPHRVVAHVHSVDAIAWAVRRDAPRCLESRLEGLRWQWLPYTESGLPLAQQMESPHDADVFILGNHGLVVGAQSIGSLARLLDDVRRRLALPWRSARPADYSVLARAAADSHWVLSDDDDLHCLATDPVSREILAGGMLYPCQAMYLESYAPVSPGSAALQDVNRPFALIENSGVLLNRSAGPVEIAMLGGLAHVVQRIPRGAAIRYLEPGEVDRLSREALARYRETANAGATGA